MIRYSTPRSKTDSAQNEWEMSKNPIERRFPIWPGTLDISHLVTDISLDEKLGVIQSTNYGAHREIVSLCGRIEIRHPPAFLK